MLDTSGGNSLVVGGESSVHVEQVYEIKINVTVHLVGFNCNSYTSSSSSSSTSVAPLSKKDKGLLPPQVLSTIRLYP